MTEPVRLLIFESVVADFRDGRLEHGRHEWRTGPDRLSSPPEAEPSTVRLPPQRKEP